MTESQTLDLSFEEGWRETVFVTAIAPNHYRLEWTPISGGDIPVYLGDVIEVEPLGDGAHRFVGVVERAKMRHYDWIVPEFFVESPERENYEEAVEAAGGKWERLMGTWLLIHLPASSPFNVYEELDRRIAMAKARRQTPNDTLK